MDPVGVNFMINCFVESQYEYENSVSRNHWKIGLETYKSRGTYKIQDIPNGGKLSDLYELVKEYSDIKKLDFSECQFSNDTFSEFISYPYKPACELAITWSDLCKQIKPMHMKNITSLTIYPPQDGLIDQTFVPFLINFYESVTENFEIDISTWSSLNIPFLSELTGKGLKINLSPEEFNSRVFQSKKDQSECKALWQEYLEKVNPSGDRFALNNGDRYVWIDSPDPIRAFFEAVRDSGRSIVTLDMKKVFFSNTAWNALLDEINQSNIENLHVSIFTNTQIQRLFTCLSEEKLAGLKSLDFSGAPFISTSLEQKERFAKLLEQYASNKVVIREPWNPTHPCDPVNEEDDATSLFRNNEFDSKTLQSIWDHIELGSSLTIGAIERNVTVINCVNSINAAFDAIVAKCVNDLKFTNLLFSAEAWDALQRRLVLNKSISSLHFVRCHLTPKMISSLGESVFSELNISDNAELENRKEFCDAILVLKEKQTNLKCLKLENNLFSDNEIYDLFETIGTWKEFSVAGNTLSPQARSYLYQLNETRFIKATTAYNSTYQPVILDIVEEKFNSDLEAFKLKVGSTTELNQGLYDAYKEAVAKLLPHQNEEFFRVLLRTNFQITSVPGDGNCFFSSCSIGMNNQINPARLREEVANYIRDHEDEYKEIVGNVKEYVLELQRGKWGGEEEISVVARKYNVPIVVYDKAHSLNITNGKLVSPLVYNAPDGSLFDHPQTIFLYRSNASHYQTLIPIGRALPGSPEILTATNLIQGTHFDLWNRLIGYCPKQFALHDQQFDIAVNDPAPIEALFQILEKKEGNIEVLDLGRIVFSETAWSAFLEGFKKIEKNISSFTFPHATVGQLTQLFSETAFENLVDLNLSRLDFISTTSKEKEALVALLSNNCRKLNKLKSIKLDNWGVSAESLGLDASIAVSNKQKTRVLSGNEVLIGNESTETTGTDDLLVIVKTLDTPPVTNTRAIENLFTRIKNPDFFRLEFHDVIFTDQSFNFLLEKLKDLDPIVNFNSCQLTPKMIRSLQAAKNLTAIGINSNGTLTEKSQFCQALKELVETGAHWKISLERNLLTDDDIKLIFQNGTFGISELILKGNCITKYGENYLNQKVPRHKRNSEGQVLSSCEIRF